MSSKISEIHTYNFINELVFGITELVNSAKNQIGLNTFGYRRFLLDGKSFGFSTNSSWNRTFIEHFSDSNIVEYENSLYEYLSTDKTIFLRIGEPNQKSIYQQYLYANDVWNNLSIYRKNSKDNCIEVFFICSTREKVGLIESCMNKIEYVNGLVDSLQEQINSKLNANHNRYFSESVNNETVLHEMSDFLHKGVIPNKITATKTKEYFNSNLSLLSNRENEIVLLLAKGFKRKQIALSLGLSPKTIDTYIDRLKKKSNVLNKNQLMQVILG